MAAISSRKMILLVRHHHPVFVDEDDDDDDDHDGFSAVSNFQHGDDPVTTMREFLDTLFLQVWKQYYSFSPSFSFTSRRIYPQ